MRTVFHAQLSTLSCSIAALCEDAGAMLALATAALLQADLAIAEHVIDRHAEMRRCCGQLETDTFNILARQSPVASDLRTVLCGLKNIADLQRMAALARHVACISRLRHPDNAVPGEVSGHFAGMGRIAAQLAYDAKVVVLEDDSVKAARLHSDDQAIDAIHRDLFTIVMDAHWPHGTPTAVDVTLLSRYYERFADHAVEIAERVIYQGTGRR